MARWTTLHVHMLIASIKKMLQRKGFSFIGAISQCPEIYGRYNNMQSALEMMEWFEKASIIANFTDPAKAGITHDKIIIGEFIDIEKPTL